MRTQTPLMNADGATGGSGTGSAAAGATSSSSGGAGTGGAGTGAAATTTQQQSTTQHASTGQASSTPASTTPAEIELTLPKDAKIDQAVLDGFKSIAKANGLNSKQAQALVEFQLKQTAAQQQAMSEAIQKQRVADLDALKGDKDFGGAKFDRSVQGARSALKQFGGEELSKLLELSGLDCHPAVVKTFSRIRDLIAEDSIANKTGGGEAAESLNAEEAALRKRYPKSPGMWKSK